MRERAQAGLTAKAAIVVICAVAIILVFGAWWLGRSSQQATEDAVSSVSRFFLDELVGRREQVVETNLNASVNNMKTAIGLLTEEDLSDLEHLQAFQAKMKKLFDLDKFAFVDENGLIYTSTGIQDNIDEYGFDYRTISGPEISVKNQDGGGKTVVIAMPLDNISFMGKKLVVCFMEIGMQEMIEGLSLQTDHEGATFCNLYTSDGVALTDMVLGGLASEDNLLTALGSADLDEGYSLERVVSDFKEGKPGLVSFTYNGIRETLDYRPVPNTDWMVTYLVRESVISDQVSSISEGITARGLAQTLATALVLLVVVGIMVRLNRRSARLAVEKEAIETETRVKQEEMERRLALQEQLLEQEKRRAQQDKMITALASDYRSVYYVDLDDDEGVCYQANTDLPGAASVGERFPFHAKFKEYATRFVAEEFREGFLAFIETDSIRKGLANQQILSYRYIVVHDGRESYEMMRAAGVRHLKDRDDGIVHAVGVGFVDVDSETREQMDRSRALSDALALAEDASRAKTAFLSSMSHEIRTPMNAIIGLDSIALADPDVPERTREKLEKIGASAHHLLGLINDILDVSRIESGNMVVSSETFSFRNLIDQVNAIISSQCSARGLDYHCQINGPVDDDYMGDEVKLRQVLINVLGNAVKYTPEGGSIEFTVERTAQFAGNSTLRFTVADTGIGIDKDYLPRIFDTFSQEDFTAVNSMGSTGLGLAITKSIVEMMNGTIEVESEKGVGTTFFITVPLVDATKGSEPAPEAHVAINEDRPPIDLAGRRILLAEDTEINAEILIELMKLREVEIEHAENGRIAVDMFSAHEPGYYDAVLMDMRMPEMDGLEATRTIRALGRDDAKTIPIIALTANAFEEDVQKSLQAGLNAHLSKPVEPEVLFETLESLVHP